MDDFSTLECSSSFCLLIEFIVLFPFLIKYYHNMFINVVFRLASDKLILFLYRNLGSLQDFYCLSQGISHGMRLLALGGEWMIFHFLDCSSTIVWLIKFHYTLYFKVLKYYHIMSIIIVLCCCWFEPLHTDHTGVVKGNHSTRSTPVW